MTTLPREFQSGSHLIHQDVFRAESADWRVYVGYDDVEEGVYATVTFKHRWKGDEVLKIELHFRSAAKALERMMRFIAQHPVAEPSCTVDY